MRRNRAFAAWTGHHADECGARDSVFVIPAQVETQALRIAPDL